MKEVKIYFREDYIGSVFVSAPDEESAIELAKEYELFTYLVDTDE